MKKIEGKIICIDIDKDVDGYLDMAVETVSGLLETVSVSGALFEFYKKYKIGDNVRFDAKELKHSGFITILTAS